MTQKLKVLHDYDSSLLLMREEPLNDCGQFDDPDTEDHPAYGCIKLEYTEDWGDDAAKAGKYYVCLHVVGPKWVSEKDALSAMSSCGADDGKLFADLSLAQQCEILLDYGISACVWQKQGHNKSQLLQEAKKEFVGLSCMFGFYMDRVLNGIGSTGWDFMRGDLDAGLHRALESGTASKTQLLVAKIQGLGVE